MLPLYQTDYANGAPSCLAYVFHFVRNYGANDLAMHTKNILIPEVF